VTTEKELKQIVDLLNQNSLNFYKLDYGYGKVKLVKSLLGSGCIRDVTGYLSKPALAEVLYGIQNYTSLENQEQKRLAEEAKKNATKQ
jgi:hypothetical protein